MITAAALTFPRLRPSVTCGPGQSGTACATMPVTCGSATKITIYNCRNNQR
jgi:hypothetical protein